MKQQFTVEDLRLIADKMKQDSSTPAQRVYKKTLALLKKAGISETFVQTIAAGCYQVN